MKSADLSPPTSGVALPLADRVCIGWVVLCSALVGGGYLLSELGWFGQPAAWLAVWAVALVGGAWSLRPNPLERQRWAESLGALRAELRVSLIGKVVLASAAFTLLVSFLVGLLTAPANWDSLTYHLARVAYFAQFGSLDDYGANFWAQEAHGRISAILLAALMVPLGMSDRLHFLPQWTSLVLLVGVVAALARQAGVTRAAALSGGALCALFTNAIMESATAQNDLVIAAFAAISLYGGLRYLRTGAAPMLFCGSVALALALGAKASAFTILPALALVIGSEVWRGRKSVLAGMLRRAGLLFTMMIAAVVLVTFPAGYAKNHQRFGTWIGPREIHAEHLVQDASIARRVALAGFNALRFASDACTIDGLPDTWGGTPGGWLKQKAGTALARAGIALETPEGVRKRTKFSFARPRSMDENYAWFGLLGPTLLVPGVLWGLGQRHGAIRALAFAAVIFTAGQCAAGLYDPWRGRQFLYLLPFAGPIVGAGLDRAPKKLRALLTGIVFAGAGVAIWAATFRSLAPSFPLPDRPAFWQSDRLAQMTRFYPSHDALRRFHAIVAPDAVVALALPADSFEYALFGRGATRWLRPVGGRLPQDTWTGFAHWLLYDERLDIEPRPDDLTLGSSWRLRQLVTTESAPSSATATPETAQPP